MCERLLPSLALFISSRLVSSCHPSSRQDDKTGKKLPRNNELGHFDEREPQRLHKELYGFCSRHILLHMYVSMRVYYVVCGSLEVKVKVGYGYG
jgi:hypothetical protein